MTFIRIIVVLLALASTAKCAYNCVRPTKPCCPKNEVYTETGAHGCQNTCQNPNIGMLCKPIPKAGCVCKEGYLRNTKGVCVLPRDCDTCKKNEVFALNTCDNTCLEPERSLNCPPESRQNGCICKKGYLRNKKGVCVLPCECDVCKENEVFVLNVTGCENTCRDPDLITRCDPNPALSRPGCVCKKGYLKNEDGRCVLPEMCTCDGDINARWDPCGENLPVTCENKDDPPMMRPTICKPEGGCVCKEGYVRNHLNACVLPEDCPKCGENEIFTCGSPCDTTCETLGETCPIVNIRCEYRCYCKEGFARDESGVCIPIDQCPPKECPTDPNAVVKYCANPCPRTCDNIFDDDIKMCKSACIKFGCDCKEGYVIGPEGKCILIEDCPPKICPTDPNAIVLLCGDPCPITCDNMNDPNPKACPAICIKNGCKCKEGYVIGPEGKCILIKDCPPKICPTDCNAIVVPCGDPCPLTCDNMYDPNPRPCPEICIKNGCKCKEGYVIGPKGKCILIKDCPPKICPTDCNAIVVSCGDPYPKTCDNMSGRKPKLCPNICIVNGCKCKEGYVIGPKGKCILIKDCPKVCPSKTRCPTDRNAHVLPCGDPCPITCENKDVEEPIRCLGLCVKNGCKCNDGFVLGPNGKCILPKDCPVICPPKRYPMDPLPLPMPMIEMA